MKAVIQRVKNASVTVDGKTISQIGQGLLIFLGIGLEDNSSNIPKFCDKIMKLRIFNDENDKMNKSVIDINGEILIVSQFTLYANTAKGNRPSYELAMEPNGAEKLYEEAISYIKSNYEINVYSGIFGADMKVDLLNDGPVTIVI